MKHELSRLPFPKFVRVALTSRCNLQCAHCQRARLHNEGLLKSADMPERIFRKFEEQSLRDLEQVYAGCAE